ncbi:enoyl-CoA hydratase [Chelatococcus reniformis]|uniref:Enoyl-CoA hydratase n=1 Tax=Chelatococcus reniformis TaxID=1494448 RepID=A0A916UV37_9HYPH|nr:enoyl-CoA hydratase [Chelatococcus reniformis]GGC89876.1 enoyl-CoA hydratase [Chelatococcus reniformis]
MSDYQSLLYDVPEPGIARITLNRPNTANAQDTQLLYELNDAFNHAAHDDDVRVIVLAANGKHFSAGHDLQESDGHAAMREHKTVAPVCGFGCAGAEAQMAREEEIYLGFSDRWRNIPKPTIAAVQGKCIAGGLMLAWPCDIIIAADDAAFADPVVSFGICGHEYFTHVWEVGLRKAKEMLFTSDEIAAEEALRLGMVNQVVPRAELMEATMTMARKIARKSRFALKLTKLAANGVQDAQGREIALRNAFHLHQLAHTHNLKVFDMLIDPTGLPEATRKALGSRLG